MSLEVITMWYNEEFLAPFFLRHYAYADVITVLYDRDSSDKTLALAEAAPNVRVFPFRFPDMLDSGLKQARIMSAYRESACDWVVAVDADEFLFFPHVDGPRNDLRPALEAGDADVYWVLLFGVYRHRSDADLDPAAPALPQRRHGERQGLKPCVVRAGLDILWKVGCHSLASEPGGIRHGRDTFFAAHWAMADPCFAVERQLKNRKNRLSRNNLERGMGCHYTRLTGKSLMETFKEHREDPQMF